MKSRCQRVHSGCRWLKVVILVGSEPTVQAWRKDWLTNQTASLLRPGDFTCFMLGLLSDKVFCLRFTQTSTLPGLFLRGAGTGGLGLAIEGPSEAKMSCKDNKDGSCSVEYIPFTPGEYDVNITFGGLPIPGEDSDWLVQFLWKTDTVMTYSFHFSLCCRKPISGSSARASWSK